VKADADMIKFFGMWKEHIMNEVRAGKMIFTDSPMGDDVRSWDVQGKDIVIGISSADI
jgi:hypothetical protein